MTRIERYKKNKEARLNGKYNGAPLFHSFPRLGRLIPAIPRGMQIMTLAGSGVGKSQSTIGISVMTIYDLIKNHNYKARIYIFLLEDPITLFEDRLFCHILYTKYNISVDPMYLNSARHDILSEDIEALFNDVDKIVEDILKYCILIDNIYHPTGLYKYLRTESGKLGTHFYEDKIFTYKNEDGSTYEKVTKVYVRYEPKDPDEHVIIVVDNLNNLAEESDKETKIKGSVRDSMGKWCRDYARLQICKHWGWTVWNVAQTALESDRQQFNMMRGEQIIEKLEPNLSALGDNKVISRDHHLVLALFSPSRFGITMYEGYDIGKLDDTFRSLIILKSNFSISNRKIGLFFNGASSYFKELPKLTEMTTEVYNEIAEFRKKQNH